MTFAKRKINVRFILGANQGTFEESGTNAVDLAGLRCEVNLVNTMGVAMNQLDISIFGMTNSLMNKLTILKNGWLQGIYNQIEVTAGQGDDMALIFVGHMAFGWADYTGAPDVCFTVQAYSGMASTFKAATALSYKGSVAASTIAQAIAASMVPPLTLENDGVDVILTDVNFPSDPMTQLKQLARAAHFDFTQDSALAVLAIFPKGKGRKTQSVDLGPDTGLVGYPAFNDKGVVLSAMFNPALRVGGKVQLRTSVTPAAGEWYPFNVHHDLESEIPDGRWFTHIEAQRLIDQGSQV